MGLMASQPRTIIFAAGMASVVGAALVPFITPYPPPPAWIWSLNIAAGLSLVAVGFLLSLKRPGNGIGLLMGLAGILYFAFTLSWFSSPFLWTLSTLTVGISLAIAAHFIVAFPEGRLRSRFDRTLVVFIYSWAAATNFSLLALFDARDYGGTYSLNLILVYGDRGVRETLIDVVDRGNLALGIIVAVVFARRWRRATAIERRAFMPLAVVLGIALVAFLMRQGGTVLNVSDRVASVLDASDPAVWVALPVALFAGVLRSQASRAAVGDLVIGIRGSTDPERLRVAVAAALRDPSLELAQWNPGAGLYVDADGRPVELPGPDSSRGTTLIEGNDRRLGVLIHDPVISQEEPKLFASVSAAVRLALENRRLAEEVSLSRLLPTGLVDRLRRDGRRIGDTETLEVTVLTSDVRGYSSIAEHADPHSLAGQLNEHRREMTRAISGQGGTVMQFVGDEVFAVFGAPMAIADHASRAIAAAQEMQATQSAINEGWRAEGLSPFGLGIGLSTGEVAAALLGSEQHTEYSVVGDTVNLAQRLQQWAQAGDVILSSNTFAAAGRPEHADALEPATVKGRAAVVAAYRLRVRFDRS